MRLRWVPVLGIMLFAMVVLATGYAGAQDVLDCEDFPTQLDAQMSLNESYPDDPNQLDAENDGIACERFFKLTDEEVARVVPANLASRAAGSTPEPTPAPPAATAAPAPVDTSTGTTSRVDPPADLMAQVASCEVVAVSSRSIAAAGCPGIGTIVLRPPAGTPRMRSQVIIRPGAAFGSQNERVATAAQVAHGDDTAPTRNRGERERPRKKHQKAEMGLAQKK